MWLLLIQNAASAMSVILGKAALRYSAPFFYIGCRMLIGGVLMTGCYILFFGKIRIYARDLFLLLQIMFFQLYIAYLCDIYAISKLSAVHASFLYAFAPFIAAVLSYWFFNEYMTFKKLVGMIIGSIGIVPMFFTQKIQTVDEGIFSVVGLILLLGVICNTYGYILMRVLIKKREYPPLIVIGLAMTGAGLCTLITSYFFESTWLVDTSSVKPFLKILLSVIIIGNIIAYGLNGYLLKKYTTTFVSFAGFLYPVFAAFFGWFFIGEPISYAFFGSIILIAIGLYIFYHEELKQGYYI